MPPSLVATLVVGLDNGSRIKRKISGTKLTLDQSLMAVIADELNFLVWRQTRDGQKGRNRPDSIYKKLQGLDDKQKDDLMSFDSPEKFDEWYRNKMR